MLKHPITDVLAATGALGLWVNFWDQFLDPFWL